MTRPRWVRASTSPRPARPAPVARRRRLTVGGAALLTAFLTAAVTDAVTGVLTNGLRGGWERVTGGESLVLNVAVGLAGGDECGTQWLLPAGTGPVPDEAARPERFVAWARQRGGAALPAPVVQLTVRGRTGEVVVLRELRATVVERRPVPPGEVATVACGGAQSVRTYSVDLDRRPPVLRPEAAADLDVPPVAFPYRVTNSDAEVIRVRAFTGGCDCRWVLDLVYVDGEQERTVRIDDDGQPFRTVASWAGQGSATPPPGTPTTRPTTPTPRPGTPSPGAGP